MRDKYLFLVVFAALLLFTRGSESCQCGQQPDDMKHDFDGSDAVFVGKVIYSDRSLMLAWLPVKYKLASWIRQESDGLPQLRDQVGVTFRVRGSWKGVSDELITVASGYDMGDCGYPFKVGQEFLVFASREDRQWSASKCSRTKPVTQAAADIRQLGQAASPEPGSTLVYMVKRYRIPFGIAAIAILGSTGIIIRRRLRRR